MEEIEGYKFGLVYDKKIDPKDAHKFATVFGEGSKALTELIEYCIVNGIPTLASCKGHPENVNILERIVEDGYIVFKYNDDKEFAYFLASIPLMCPGITVFVENNNVAGRTISMYVPARSKGMSEKYFQYILVAIKEYRKFKEDGKQVAINSVIKGIVDYTFAYLTDYSFAITCRGYKKYERNGTCIKKVARCNNKDIDQERIDSFICATKHR